MGWRKEMGRRRRIVVGNLINTAWRRMQAAGVLTAESAAGRRFAKFGPGTLIGFPTGAVYGEPWIEIGDKTMVAELVTICAGMAPGQDLGPAPLLRIGDRCVIGRGSHIVAHHSIVIEDDIYTGPYVYITDQNHRYDDIDTPIGRQWPVNSAVRIGAGTWLGTGAVILPGANIGRNVVVAAGSVVRGTVPDYSVVAGVPARVVRQHVNGSGWSRPARPGEVAAGDSDLAVAGPAV
jgi:acetyltransferase-like isoleucine patch superfamily enzyme